MDIIDQLDDQIAGLMGQVDTLRAARREILKARGRSASKKPPRPPVDPEQLRREDDEALRLLAAGVSFRKAAEQVGISLGRVQRAKNKSDAVAAIQRGELSYSQATEKYNVTRSSLARWVKDERLSPSPAADSRGSLNSTQLSLKGQPNAEANDHL